MGNPFPWEFLFPRIPLLPVPFHPRCTYSITAMSPHQSFCSLTTIPQYTQPHPIFITTIFVTVNDTIAEYFALFVVCDNKEKQFEDTKKKPAGHWRWRQCGQLCRETLELAWPEGDTVDDWWEQLSQDERWNNASEHSEYFRQLGRGYVDSRLTISTHSRTRLEKSLIDVSNKTSRLSLFYWNSAYPEHCWSELYYPV